MKVAILAGGLGKRLATVSHGVPKAMMPVGGRPFLEHLILRLRRQGFAEVTLCTGCGATVLRAYFGDGALWDLRIDYSHEAEPLGTGGAVKRALARFRDENFLVMNGDSLANGDFRDLVAFHFLQGGVGTLALARVENTRRFGRVEVDGQGRIHRFGEKDGEGPGLINGGVYVLTRRAFDLTPEGPFSLEHDLFPRLIEQGLYGRPWGDHFVDIGEPEDYRRLVSSPPAWPGMIQP
jgi:NDP-sugar pyrophosphorylase family protein